MLREHRFIFNMIWLIVLLTIPLPLIVTIGNGLPEIFGSRVLAINLGVFAYSWMLSAIFLSSQPKWLDRIIGLPDMYIIHGVTAIFAVIFMYLHDQLLKSSGLISLTGEWAMYIFMAVIIYSLVFMAGWLTSRISILMRIKKMLEKIFKHELSMWIHRLNLVAALLAFLHVLLIPYIRSIVPFTILVVLYTVIAFGSYGHYAYNKYINVQVGLLKNVRKVDSNITELIITTSKSVLRKIEAGDFAFISFPNIKGMKEPHPFSILNIPERDGYVQMSIEGVGDFTKNLPNLETEEKVNLTRGYGVLSSMIEKSGKNEKFVLIGGGIGVVPLLGLAEKFDNKNITFLYTVKKDKKLLYQEKFKLWNERNNFKSYSQNGRFTTEQLDKYLPVGEEYNYIIAGPMEMNIAYEKMLKEKGIKKNRIFYEGFNF